MLKLNGPLTLPYTGTSDLLQYRRVKITSGEPAYAGATDEDIGELDRRVIGTPSSGAIPLGAGLGASVVLKNEPGVHWMVADGAITQWAAVYGGANGKVSATPNSYYIGIAEEAATADGDLIGVIRKGLNSTGSETGTTGTAFTVDSDSTIPKIALASQTAGTGDYTTTLKPESTLSGNNTIIVPEANGDVLAAVALAQTLTNKTLTSPTLNTPLIGDGDTGVSITSADQTHAAPTVTIPDIADAADEFVMKDTTQTLTLKTLTSPVITQPGSNVPVYVPQAAQQAISGPGAINVTSYYTAVTTTGVDAFTLADGAVKGQQKKIQLIVDGGDATLTPSNLAGGTTITFADVGDFALLSFDGTDWVAIELGNDADGVTAPVLA